MKKPLLLMLIIALFCQPLKAIDFFKGDYQQGLAKAKTENKQLLLYFTATWCGPCKYMEQYVYPNAGLTEYINQHYIALKIDIDAKDGKLLYVKAHQPKGPMGVPAFIIMNSEEEVIKKQTGAMKLNQLQDFLLIDKQTPIIYKLLTDSLAKAQITIDQKKPTTFNKLYFNAMVSHWKPGLKIGANLMGFSGSLPSTGATMGYEIGIFLDRSFKNKDEQIGFWHSSRYIFQPGLTLTSKAGHFTTNNTRKSINIHYLALDLLNSYQFKGLRYYRIFASPYVATGLWATQKQVEERQPLTFGDDFSRLDYGLRFGMSRNMGSFEPFIGYNFGLKDVKTGADVIHHRGFYASFAIIIGK